MYRTMLLARNLDDRLIRLQRQGRISFHIGSLGEEAAIVGSAAAMLPADWIWPCYREFAAALYRGMPLEAYLDNMFGNADDPSRGRQMPDHWTGRAWNVGSVSSPVGTQIAQAPGMAWAAKRRGDDVAVLVYFGEGATSEGDFHVGLNFAGVFKAPCIFFCRNNGWAISVPASRQTASKSIAVKATAYGVAGVQVDGNDVLAVHRAVREARERCRRGEGATLIEALTYRLGPHSTSDDPRGYRKEEEVEPWRAADPLPRFRRYLEQRGLWSDADEERVTAEIESEIRAAIEVAERKGPPPLESLFDDVYARRPWHLEEQYREALRLREEG
ncbi:MAG: thiamine pyrophosphate-dependent dehydrogenase E1 component subunit alpha [Deltaproteobacteria bacterium]|nr:thiamine pyrophosphate-dependent dehydrogenase E1 component subunit alpha [Deltaproteobacteria bacterium]